MRWLVVATLVALGCSPPPEQQTEYNYLVNTLNDLDHRTPNNAAVLQLLCNDYQKRAEQYRKIRAWRINAKVDRYVAGCAKVMAELGPPKLPND